MIIDKYIKNDYLTLTAVVFFFFAQTVCAQTEAGYTYAVNSDDDTTVQIISYSGAGGDLVIPDTLGGKTVTKIGEEAFSFNLSLTNVTIPVSVIEIDSLGFFKCTSLVSVTIPDGLNVIGDGAFFDCTNLLSVTIPDSVTTIGLDAFAGCRSIESFTVTSGNATYSSIGGVLFNKLMTNLIKYPPASTLSNYTIPNGVTEITKDAFLSCNNLTNVTLPDSILVIGQAAFFQCLNLTSVNIPEGVTNLAIWAFAGCSSLESINIPSSITVIERFVFQECTALGSVTLPDSVTEIKDYAFADCTALVSLSIPESVASIANFAFYNCSSLDLIYFRGNQPELGSNVFSRTTANAYYRRDYGWPSGGTYGGLTTILWEPIIQDQASSFGIQLNGAFNFDIKFEGLQAAGVKVLVSNDLITWEEHTAFDFNNSSSEHAFTDAQASTGFKRYYLLDMP